VSFNILNKNSHLKALVAYVEITKSAAVPSTSFCLVEASDTAEAFPEMFPRIAVPTIVDFILFLLSNRVNTLVMPGEVDWLDL
jgi:hypothetical protein